MYYFAYGSNMNHQQMKKRCPSSHYIKRVFLENYKFVYDGYSNTRSCAVANVVYTGIKNDIVWGGLFEINKSDLNKLDRYEDYPCSYNRKEVIVKDDCGNTCKAIVYFRIGECEGKPSQEYRNIIIKGARDCGLPEDYIKIIYKECT